MVAVVSSSLNRFALSPRIGNTPSPKVPRGADGFEHAPAKIIPHPRAASVSDPRFVEVALSRMATANGDEIQEVQRAYRAARDLPPNLKNNVGLVRGYMVEALGREELARRFPGHQVDHGVEIRKGAHDNVLGELDAIVIREADGKVAAVAEAKASVEKMSGGLTKVRAHLARIQGSEVNHYQTRGDKRVWHFDDSEGPHARSTFANVPQSRCFAVGPKNAPDRPDYVRIQVSEGSIGGIAALIVAQSREAKIASPMPMAA
ncbi:MAG: hypothetical protein HY791_38970 [Deltaproteobacteria bacterium]|nr:hypothetical protein [Deltaproteobacteria bacterium]